MRNGSCLASVIVASVAASACGGVGPEDNVGAERAATGDVATAKQPITNGWVVAPQDEEYSSWLKLEVNSNNYVYCSATLMANNWAYSASHCFDGLQERRPSVSMGSQRTRVSTVWRDPVMDIALFTLETPFYMWNWNVNAFGTNPAQINNWQYARGFYTAGSASLNNQNALCAGIAPGGPGASYKFGMLNLRHFPMDPLLPLRSYKIAAFNQIQQDGDSGGGCFLGWNFYTSPLVGISTDNFGDFERVVTPEEMTNFYVGVLVGAIPPAFQF